jgi:hypothetical protein
MRPRATVAICLAVAAAALAGFLAGRWSRAPLTCAVVRKQAPISKPLGDGGTFVVQGRLTVEGMLVRMGPDSGERPAATRLIIVHGGADRGIPGNYEVFYDRGIYQVIRGAKPVPFAVVRVINPDRAVPFALGQQVSLRGSWGEVDYKDLSSTSLPDLGMFVTELD